MRNGRTAGWIAGTVILVLAMFGLTWTFVASPRFDVAAETLAEAESTRSRNDILRIELVQLRADFEKLDEYKAELAALRTQVPTQAEMADYARTVNDLATQHGVTVVDMAPGVPVEVTVPTPPAPPQPAAVEGEDETTTEDGEDAPDVPAAPAAPAAPAQIEGFVAIPTTLKVIGPYANVSAFLEAVQTGVPRLFLVTQLDGQRQDEAEASAGKPATAPGDLELTIQGNAYVLLDGAALLEDMLEEELGDKPKDPLPNSPRNPFVPLG